MSNIIKRCPYCAGVGKCEISMVGEHDAALPWEWAEREMRDKDAEIERLRDLRIVLENEKANTAHLTEMIEDDAKTIRSQKAEIARLRTALEEITDKLLKDFERCADVPDSICSLSFFLCRDCPHNGKRDDGSRL